MTTFMTRAIAPITPAQTPPTGEAAAADVAEATRDETVATTARLVTPAAPAEKDASVINITTALDATAIVHPMKDATAVTTAIDTAVATMTSMTANAPTNERAAHQVPDAQLTANRLPPSRPPSLTSI